MSERFQAQSVFPLSISISLFTLFLYSATAIAQTYCWIDAKTGEQVPTVPRGATGPLGGETSDPDNHRVNPKTGQNFVRLPDGTWIDAQTGQQVPTVPRGGTGPLGGETSDPDNHRVNPKTGQNFVRVPCPPPTLSATLPTTPSTSWTGAFIGGQLAGSFSHVGTNEFSALTGVRTNQFDDSGSSFGGGVNFGYNWQPWGNGYVVGAVFDINGFNDKVDHGFAGGTFIGSTVDVTGSAQIRAGVLATPSLLLYGQTGLNVAGQRLQINFGGPVTDESKVTPGYTLGAGAEFMLPMSPFPGIGASSSLFIDYDHTWWEKESLAMPIASPFFNYSWRRDSDVVKGGFRIRFGS